MSIHGSVDPSFWPVAASLERQLRRFGGGAAVCVYCEGRKVADLWGGHRDGERSWRRDTMAMSFSTTKGVVSTALHLLADRKLFRYDDPVSRHWPAFAQGGKAGITIRDVLTHRAGLPAVRTLIDRSERILDWDYMVRALERARPRLRPGGSSAYHAFTYGWLAGELVQRISGRPLAEVIREEIAQPLGLKGLFIGAPPRVRSRTAELSQPGSGLPGLSGLVTNRTLAATARRFNRSLAIPFDPLLAQDALIPAENPGILWEPRVLDAAIPAANGVFTARSLARMYALIAEGGELDGVRLLSPRTVAALSRVQTRGADRVLFLPMHWRLGYHGAFTTRGRVSSGFGHFGYGGSGAWADPERRVSVAMVNNRVGGGPFGDLRIAELGTAALRGRRRWLRRRGEPAPELRLVDADTARAGA